MSGLMPAHSPDVADLSKPKPKYKLAAPSGEPAVHQDNPWPLLDHLLHGAVNEGVICEGGSQSLGSTLNRPGPPSPSPTDPGSCNPEPVSESASLDRNGPRPFRVHPPNVSNPEPVTDSVHHFTRPEPELCRSEHVNAMSTALDDMQELENVEAGWSALKGLLEQDAGVDNEALDQHFCECAAWDEYDPWPCDASVHAKVSSGLESAEGSSWAVCAPCPSASRPHDWIQTEVARASSSLIGSLALRDVVTHASASSITLPWETPFAKMIFEGHEEALLKPLQGLTQPQDVPRVLPCFSEPSPKPAFPPDDPIHPRGSVFVWAIAKASTVEDRDPEQERSLLMVKGVHLWVQLSIRFQKQSQTFRQVDAASDQCNEDDLFESMSAVMGNRSPHTVVKRGSALSAFVRFMDTHFPHILGKVAESHAWAYVKYLKESNAPPTKGASFVSSLRFAYFVAGFDLQDTFSSRRVGGLSSQMYAEKRKLKQAAVLSVSQVARLHQSLKDRSLHKFDRLLLAAILLRLYGRARHSDLLFIIAASLDKGVAEAYVCFEVSQHKGAGGARQKAQVMPILVPMIGVHGECWIDEAAEAFSACGLCLESVSGPLVPAPADEGATCFAKRSIKSSELGKALRGFLGQSEAHTGEGRLSSHSLRATCLSWVSKYGLDTETSSILGRHASSAKVTAAIYSRDLCVAPTRALQGVIKEIASGSFVPDNPRSKHCTFPPDPGHSNVGVDSRGDCKPAPAANVAPPIKSEALVISDDERADGDDGPSPDDACDNSSSSSSSSDSSEDEECAQPPTVRRYKRARPCEQAGQVWYMHRKSTFLHLRKNDSPILACGRPVNVRYERASVAALQNCEECRTCRRNM